MLASYLKDGKIAIGKEDWKLLNQSLSKEDIIDEISNLIESNNLKLPLREICLDEAVKDFAELVQLKSSLKYGKFYSRYLYKYPFLNLYIDAPSTGNKSSDYFHQENRFLCNSINSPSPYRTWTVEKFRKNLLKSLWTLKVEEVNDRTLRSCIGLRKYIASQFKPSAAKTVYEYFNAVDVLDFSMGWGDRLAGFYASSSTKSYVGIDPNLKLFEGYRKQHNVYGGDKKVEFHNSAAEDFDFSSYADKFDLIFTSPPYFIIERYSNESNQSWQRYKKLDAWLDKFLYTVINKTAPTLKSGGYLAINISDVYCNHTVNRMCDPMNDFIKSLRTFEYLGALGLRMSKRPNSKAVGDGIFAEPIWIWKKC